MKLKKYQATLAYEVEITKEILAKSMAEAADIAIDDCNIKNVYLKDVRILTKH